MLAGLLVGESSPANAASPPGTTCSVLPADNIWNTDISTLPVHAQSAAWLASSGATSGWLLHPDFGGPPYGIPFNVVTSSHATANFNFLYWRESDPTVATQQPQGPYPYGTDLQIEQGSDSHLLTVVADTCKLYEIAGTNNSGPLTGWSGAIFDLSSNALRPDTWTSADAAGLPIFPGLVRLDEVQAGAIRHAIRFTVQQTDTSHLWPARHDAGAASNPNLPPMGARFRLKAGFDISGFNAAAQVVLTAMKHYGLIVADNGSDWYFQGTEDAGWNSEPYATMVTELKTVPASAFEAVDESSLMIDPNSGQAAQPGPPCTAAALAPNVAAPQAPGAGVVFTARAMGCQSPQFRYWVLAPGGRWTMLRDYGPATWTWNTGGLATGTYEVGVWARQAGSASSYDAYGITTFALDPQACTSAGLAATPGPPQAQGALVTLTASSTGCASPAYQFWVLPPGGSWTVVQPYAATSSWQLDTRRYAPGNLQVGVWVRQGGSTAGYDAFYVMTYAVTATTGCVVASLNPSVASPQAVSTSVTFTPQQAGCSKQYEFWLLPPGGFWRVVQAYGVVGTWTWNSSGMSPGVYEVGVWEGSGTSPSSYEAYAITTFTLGVAACTSTLMAANVAPPQASGTMVTWTASATRCATPQYRFWLLAPGGSWTTKQQYGSGSWSWDTTGLAAGTYQAGVWAHQAGSTPSYDAYFITTFQIQ